MHPLSVCILHLDSSRLISTHLHLHLHRLHCSPRLYTRLYTTLSTHFATADCRSLCTLHQYFRPRRKTSFKLGATRQIRIYLQTAPLSYSVPSISTAPLYSTQYSVCTPLTATTQSSTTLLRDKDLIRLLAAVLSSCQSSIVNLSIAQILFSRLSSSAFSCLQYRSQEAHC